MPRVQKQRGPLRRSARINLSYAKPLLPRLVPGCEFGDNLYGKYFLFASRQNKEGNFYTDIDYSELHCQTARTYYYANRNGSYFYNNPDGSAYYNPGYGGGWYSPPENRSDENKGVKEQVAVLAEARRGVKRTSRIRVGEDKGKEQDVKKVEGIKRESTIEKKIDIKEEVKEEELTTTYTVVKKEDDVSVKFEEEEDVKVKCEDV